MRKTFLLIATRGGLLIPALHSLHPACCQTALQFSMYDGIAVTGYVDAGAYLNFTGPNINLTCKRSKLIAGMLPSLRLKEDHDTPGNAFVTPNLGVGLTYSYKCLALQLPFYYNTKTAVKNGSWNMGIGIRLNELNKSNH